MEYLATTLGLQTNKKKKYIDRIFILRQHLSGGALWSVLRKLLKRKPEQNKMFVYESLDRTLTLHYAAIELCLKLREQGLVNIVNPYAEAYFYRNHQQASEMPNAL